jgi:hypothetical protein
MYWLSASLKSFQERRNMHWLSAGFKKLGIHNLVGCRIRLVQVAGVVGLFYAYSIVLAALIQFSSTFFVLFFAIITMWNSI